MDIIALAFWFFLIAALIIISCAGGREERLFSLAILVAVSATFFTNVVLGFSDAQMIILLIDSGLLAFTLFVAISSSKHWPIWFAGFHLIGVASSIAYAAFPANISGIYIDMSGFWSLPALGAAAIGVLLDRRVRGQNR